MENSRKLQKKKYFYRLDSNPSGHLGSGFYLYFPVFQHLRMYYFQHPGFKQTPSDIVRKEDLGPA